MSQPARTFLRQATALVTLVAILGGQTFGAPIPINSTGAYAQNFNTLPNTGSVIWANDSTLTGWWAQRTGTGTGLAADAGTGTAGNLYSYGSSGSSDRSLGAIGSGGATAGHFAWGVQFQNTGSGPATLGTLQYIGEQWRNGGNTAANVISMWYAIGSSPFTTVNPGTNNTGWTALTALDFPSPINTSTVAALDGNNPANRVSRSSNLGLTLNAGQYIVFRWSDPDHGGTDHGLAIDDFQLGWTYSSPPPAGDPTYWDANGTTAGVGETGTWSSSSPLFSSGTDGIDATTRSDGNTVTFAGPAGTVTVSDTVNANSGLTFATSGYTLSGGTVSLGGATAAANTITTNAATAIAINSVLAGSNGLTKAGPGTLTLGAANTYVGGTTVSAGTLSVVADAALGNSTDGITLGGGTLEMASGFTLGSGRTITAATGTSSAISVTSGTVAFAGPLTGSGSLDKAGAGRLSLGNVSSGYTGTFTISAGTLEITAANAFANATLTQTGGTLLLAPHGGGDVTIPEIGGSGGEVSVASGASAAFGGNSNRTYGGRIRGQGALKKEGTGILTLSADNDFAGHTRIAQGRLKLGASGALSATPRIDIDSGAIFDVADKSGFALGTGQRLGGKGTVLGSLEFGSGSQFAFDPTGPLLVGSGTVSFAAGFGIGSIFGLDATVAEGTYTLLNETTGGSISFANLANVGPGSPFDLGGGKAAYFQQGSLQVVVVPEPETFFIGGLGLALAGLATCRPRRRRSCPDA